MKVKKPFKRTFLGKIFTKEVIKNAIGEGLAFIPVAGPLLSNVLTKTNGVGANEIQSPVGKLDIERAKLQLYGVLLIGFLASALSLSMGWLTIEEIKQLIYLFDGVIG